MQQVALFDLDDTLVDRRAAFTRTTGTKGPFFQDIRERFALSESAVDLWHRYR